VNGIVYVHPQIAMTLGQLVDVADGATTSGYVLTYAAGQWAGAAVPTEIKEDITPVAIGQTIKWYDARIDPIRPAGWYPADFPTGGPTYVITYNTSDPTGGANGDIHLKYA
jgi:hypothetical protein